MNTYKIMLFLQNKHEGELKVEWKGIKKPSSLKQDSSIEHIYPQTTDNPCWTDKFKDTELLLLHDLGNLVLLPMSINSALQNKCFHDKKERFRLGSYSTIDVASYDDWTPDSIKKRTEKMLEFMWKRWEVKLFTPNV